MMRAEARRQRQLWMGSELLTNVAYALAQLALLVRLAAAFCKDEERCEEDHLLLPHLESQLASGAAVAT